MAIQVELANSATSSFGTLVTDPINVTLARPADRYGSQAVSPAGWPVDRPGDFAYASPWC
jgi:hypothetical protein